MKIIITGGHLSPAFSLISDLKDWEVLFICRKYALEGDKALSLEYQTCQEKGINTIPIQTGRFQRSFTQYTVPSLLKLPVGVAQALIIIQKFKPDVIIGFGGYVSLPVVFAGKILGIPIVIHEQTFEVGMANKVLAKLANKICISWPQSKDFFPEDKTILTGNPIRKELANPQNEKKVFNKKDSKLPVVYITGGSLGSHFINNLVYEALEDLLKKVFIIHQTGDSQKYNDFAKLDKKKNLLSKKGIRNYVLKKFFTVEELAFIYRSADLVISRAGINTITELAFFNKPALLIPLPTGQKGEQLKNASFYRDLGLAEIALEYGLNSSKLQDIVFKMLKNINKYKNTKEIVDKNASRKILEVLENVAGEKLT